MSLLRAGVIGAGAFGRHHARKYAEDARVELIGVFDLDSERAQMAAETHHVRGFASIAELLDAVDVVTIATPPSTHGKSALDALTAGKHVLVEKPIATDRREAALLVETARENKLVLACGHQERLVFEAMGLYAASELERPTLIESVREGPWTGRSADVSVTLDLMVHDLDLALSLLRGAPSGVVASGSSEHGASADEIDARLMFHGAEAHFVSSRIAAERKRTMRAVFPSGEVRVDFLARTFENTTKLPLHADFAETPAGRDPLGANVARFIDAVTGVAARPAVDGVEAARVLALALAVDAAAGLPSLS